MSGGVGPGPQGKDAVVNTEYGSEGQRQGHESSTMAAETIEDAEALANENLPPTDGQSAAILKQAR